MKDEKTMRTWAEIDLDALAGNCKALRAMTHPGCKYLGVVKADAYGHGAVPVAKTLQAMGADMLAVACLSEAQALRAAGITMPILCLGQTDPAYAPELLAADVTQAVEDLETGKALSAAAAAAGRTLTIHVKLDTGMGRLGLLWRDGEDHTALLDDIAALCALPGLKAEGLFAHYANADEDEAFTMAQLTRFLDARDALKARGVQFAICHTAASSATVKYPCTHLDMVRPGLALYGYCAGVEREEIAALRPVMTLKSRIAAVRALPKGSTVSYGCTATLTRDSRIAVLPVGYGDGYPRQLSNQADVLIHGTPCPVLGRICMDMCMVDVTDLPQVQAGDVATVYDGARVEAAARKTGTIQWELLCRIAPRVPRLYFQGGQRVN